MRFSLTSARSKPIAARMITAIIMFVLAVYIGTGKLARAQSSPALPQGGAFAAGSGAIGPATSGALNITQNSARGIIDWKSFSIGAGGRVFLNNGSGATLNRVLGGSLSRIDGLLKASGSVYLINPNGIVIGPDGSVLTGGSFVASTRDVANSAFLSLSTLSLSGKSAGDVTNLGAILARDGNVLLIGNAVQNAGSIAAPRGTAGLIAANNVLLTNLRGPNGIYVAPDASASGDVTQSGRIEAAAAALKAAGGNIYTLAGNRNGLISATGTETVNGELWLSAPQGTVNASGILAASNTNGTGGSIVVNGANVAINGGARISAQGTSGGSILIGTSAPGGVNLANTTTIASGASILAGGTQGGGSIETSGRRFSLGNARIAAGKGGSWLVDPIDLTIDTTAASTIASSLDSGTNVTEQTTASTASGSGVQSAGAGDITVAAPITWTGSGALTLSAYNNLNINAPISGAGSFNGAAGAAIATNANVSAANVLLSATGNLTLASGVSISGASGVTLQTSGQFINNAGASALSGGTGSWLVYSSDPSADTTGGLTPNFLQYAANWNTTPAASGNGLLYSIAPSLSVALSGTVEKTYDGTTAAAFNGSNASVSGLINSDSATVSGTYGSKNAGSGIGVTASNIAVTHSGIPVYGYAGTNPSASASIGQIDRAPLTANIVGNPTKTYNGTTTAALSSSNYQLSGFAPGEGATVNQPSSVAYDSADAGARTISATFSPTNFVANGGTSFSNYVLPGSASGAGTINPAPLLITGVLATDKTYDRTASDPLNTAAAALYGKIGSDDVSLVTSGATGTFSTANAGTNLAVSASGFSLSGAKASDYALTQPQGLSASISPASLSISGVAATNKTYDGTPVATLNTTSAALNGVVAGDSITLGSGSATGTFSTPDAGSAINVNASGFSISGSAAANYRLTQPTGLSANIYQKAITVAITATPTKTYNGDSSAVVDSSGFSLSGFIGGQSATIGQTAHTNYATANAGTQAVTATLAISDYVAGSGTKLSNYLLPSSATGTGIINQAPITISLVGNPTKTYDGNALATLGSSNFLLTGFLNGQSASVNQTSGLYDSVNAGPRSVTANLNLSNFTAGPGTLLSNYSFPTTVSGYGTINPAPLGAGYIGASITGNPTKTYDGTTTATLVPSDFSLTGFVNGDGATVTQTVGQYASKNVGVQPVTVNLSQADFTPNQGTNLSNYTLPTVAYGSGTINPALLNISIINTPTKVYNGTTTATLSASNFSVSGLASGEGVNIANGVPASYDSTQAGSRTVTASLPASDVTPQSGTLLSNYTIPATASGPGLITQAPLSILGIAAQSKTYDTTTNATIGGSARLFGVVGSDQVNLSGAGVTASFASPNAANNIAVSASGYTISGADAANYQLNQPSGLAANIYRAPLSITGVAAQNKNYDATNTATLNTGSAALSGVFSADNGQVSLDTSNESASFAAVNVGNNLAVSASGFALAGAQAGNYYLNQPTGLSANILPAPLTALIVGNPTKVYDGSTSTTLHASNYQLVGFAAGQGATVPQNATANYVAPDAGSEGIVSTLVSSDFVANSGTNLANYILPTTGSGTGTITPAPLTAKIVGNPTKTYDATTAAALNASNYVLSGFIGAQGATVTQTAGTYSSANAGSEPVSATLASGNFTATGSTNLNNYQLPTSASGTGTINKAPLQVVNVNATSRAYNGGYADTLDVSSAGVSGLFGSDTVTLNSGSASGLFASKDVGTGIGVAASGFSISGGASANYTLSQPTGLAADITQATLSLTKVARVYDSTTNLPGASSAYTLTGIFGGDAVSVDTSNLSGNYADKNVGTGKNVTLSGLALSGAQAGDYSIASSMTNAAIGQITPAPLTVGNAAALNKVYDATTAATLDNSSATLAGLFAGDAVTLNTGAASGVFSNKNAGVNKTVTASGYSVSGSDATNYTFTQPTGLTANITPYTGLSLTSITKTYDGTVNLPGTSGAYLLAGAFNGDNVAVNAAGISGSYAQKNVGSALAVNLSGLALSGTDAANYSMSATLSNAPIGTINQKSLGVSIVGTPTKTYDTTTAATLTSANFSLTNFVAGEGATVTQTSGTYANASANTWLITSNLAAGDFTPNGGTLLSNYILPTVATGNGKINKAPLAITGVLATNKIYDGNTNDTLNTTSAALSGLLGSDTATLNTGGAAGTFASKNVGTGIGVTASGFTISGGASSNYTLSQPSGLTANITQALLNLASVTKMYDATTSAVGGGVSYTLSGVKGGDVVALNTAGLSGSYAAKNVGTGINVSMSGLSLTGAQAANYSINASVTNAQIGTITKAPLSLSGITVSNKVYDGTNAATINNGGAVFAGLLGADSVSFSGPASGTFAQSNAGTWAVTAGGSYSISGADAGNYNFAQPTGLSATITRAPLTASITGNPTKTYDNTASATLTSGNYMLSGFVGSQSATVNQTSGTYDSSDAGARIVTALLSAGNFTAGGGTNLSNYILPTSASGAGTISAKALSAAIIGNPAKIYDGTQAARLNAGNFQLTGFVGGQGATVGQTAGTYDSVHAGARSVNAALSAGDFTANNGTNLGNYVLPLSASGPGTIAPQTLTAAIAGNPTKTYDATAGAALNSSNYVLSGFVSGEGATVNQAAGTYDSANAGARTVNASLNTGNFSATGSTNLGDYVLPTSASGPGTISPKALTATITGNPTKTYDAGTSAALNAGNYQLSGFIGADNATVTQTAGTYAGADAGSQLVTALLSTGNFTPTGGTILANYALPASASGAGTIAPKALNVAITGSPAKTYDGTNNVTLAAADYTVSGFVAGQGGNITQTAGSFDSADAGARTVTASLASANLSGNTGTNPANYVLPASAAGAGTIHPKLLTAAISGTPTKTYDATTAATLGAGDYQLSGFVGGDGATVNQTAGQYAAADAGSEGVTASLNAGNFTATGSTNLANYVLPTGASGTGTILAKTLFAAITGTPNKTYDGSNNATLSASDYTLSGFVGGEGASVRQTAGAYDSANAGTRTVTAALGSGDFTANTGTNLANYVLPGQAAGAGSISPKALTAAITGTPTKTYDSGTSATLTAASYQLSGFVGTEGATVTQTAGNYAGADAGSQNVTASLGSADFVAGAATNLNNYLLPTSASGAGTILPKALSATITGAHDKTYDGTTSALVASGDYSLQGFVTGQGASVSQTAATYDSANAGARTLTAQLSANNFSANSGTNLNNYILPATAAGTGSIHPKTLAASITGNPAKSYDGTGAAALTASDYTMSGFVAGQGAAITQTAGSYDAADAGARTVTAALAPQDFSAAAGTLLGNYVLPTSASGLGRIDPALLTASIVNVSKTYDGTVSTLLNPANFTLNGFVAGQGAAVLQNAGTYASADAGTRAISATLTPADFRANAGTNLANYILPASAAGVASIQPKALFASISGNPAKIYDGTASALLDSGDYTMAGFVAGQSAAITQTAGSYDAADAGARMVTALLGARDFAAAAGTNLANYILPVNAAGPGTITPRALTASLIGTPTKMNDGTLAALLTPANFSLTGFVAGEGARITQTAGQYDLAQAGARTVSAALAPGNYQANAGTLLANYVLPVSAMGPGLITPAVETNAPTLAAAVSANMSVRNLAPAPAILTTAIQTLFAAAVPRTYIPYPAPSALSTWQNNGFGSLPAIVDGGAAATSATADGRKTIGSGAPVINTTEQILLQGGKNKNWKIALPPSTEITEQGGRAQ